MRRTIFYAVITGAAACGGTAIVDPPLEGEGGAGGAGGAGGSASSTTVDAASSTAESTTSGSGGATSTCEQACTDLYNCGLETVDGMQLCPGFTGSPMEVETFLYGNGEDGCVGSCQGNPVLTQLVDPTDCEATVDSLESASADFADLCENGF